MDKFVGIELRVSTLDVYCVRSSIFRALRQYIGAFHGRLLDIGCGKMPYKEYIVGHSSIKEYVGLDIEDALIYDDNIKPDYTWNGSTMPFKSESFDCAFATEVLEHCPDPNIVLKEVIRVLKPSGVFFFTVPFLWPLHEVPHDEYRYTPYSLERHLKKAGFHNVEIKALGGWQASMAQMLGLWVRRSPISIKKKIWMSYLLKPVIKFLIKKDSPVVSFKEEQMITGLYGLATK